jgi:hypothetical protein
MTATPHSLVTVLAVLLTAALGAADTVVTKRTCRPPGWGPIAAEAGGGLVGGAIVGAGGLGAGLGLSLALFGPMEPLEPGLLVTGACAAAGVSLGTTIGTCVVGRACDQNGRWVPTFLGALAGTIVGVPAFLLGERAFKPLLLVGPLLPVTGAVLGYNLSARRGIPPSRSGVRLQPPCLALTGVELPDHSVEYGVKVQLAGLRF